MERAAASARPKKLARQKVAKNTIGGGGVGGSGCEGGGFGVAATAAVLVSRAAGTRAWPCAGRPRTAAAGEPPYRLIAQELD